MPDLVVEFKIEANVDGGEVGYVAIVDADDPDVFYEEMPQYMTREQAQALAERRGLPFREV